MGVSRIDATATEAMRRASNGPALAAAIARESGLRFASSPGRKARYATLGVISGFFSPVGLVGDMGGGSLEVAEAIDDHVGGSWVSLPLGALPVEGHDMQPQVLAVGVERRALKPVLLSRRNPQLPGLSDRLAGASGGVDARADLDAGSSLKRSRVFLLGESLEAALPAFGLVDVVDDPCLFLDLELASLAALGLPLAAPAARFSKVADHVATDKPALLRVAQQR